MTIHLIKLSPYLVIGLEIGLEVSPFISSGVGLVDSPGAGSGEGPGGPGPGVQSGVGPDLGPGESSGVGPEVRPGVSPISMSKS